MKDSNFVWTDLSTFDLIAAKKFYSKIFGWDYQAEEGYHIGYVEEHQAAGIFTMPEKFQKIGLPSFWMSYISVTDIDTVVAQAQQMGGIIEVKPTDFMGQGKIALIRDPSGAGFTVWEGSEIGGKDASGTPGRMAWNELYVSDAALVLDFYRTVFGWSFTLDRSYNGERYDIRNGNGTVIAALEVMPNEIKGKHEFWIPYFAVEDLDKALILITNEGGKIVNQSEIGDCKLAMATDPQGAAFALVENRNGSRGYRAGGHQSPADGGGLFNRLKPLTFLAFIIIYIAVLFDLQWVWGLLFLLWLIRDVRFGQAHLVEPIDRAKNPIWYWLIILTWFWMSIYLLLTIFM